MSEIDESALVAAQTGRRPREPWRVAARCRWGYPTVIVSPSRLADGTPFPTYAWLTCPHLARVIAERESGGGAAHWASRAKSEPDLAEQLRAVDDAVRALRERESGGADDSQTGIAGQRDPLGVKCLHAHVALALVGVDDPIGRAELGDIETDCDDARCARLKRDSEADESARQGSQLMDNARRLAAIDIGTVTMRLLVADVSEEGVSEVARSTDIIHLGEGLTASGRLSEAAMQRAAEVVARYAATIAELGVERTTALATSASRDAENAGDFVATLAAHGILPEIVSGDREAQLSFLGAVSQLDAEEDLLVADLGGGSTELVLGNVAHDEGVRTAEICNARSVDVGSKRVTEMFLHSDPPSIAELAEARAWIVEQFRPYFDGLRDKPRLMISLAGTATTLSAIHMGLETYDPQRVHMSVLGGSDLADLLEMLSALPLADRLNVVGLDPGRAPVIVAGTLILETIVALAGLDSTLVSEHDILYGILLDTYERLA